ncbi:homeodomain-interacting protein kinase 1-like [Thunnus maccoyii]|uniref:homeodomain-interacting protein kinase 1-like n=1 Tax=Thunnus maccoyii TaxID=8240 RepID=UPI001C4CE0D4|nr:homeodomain-interacting protein kinase 1-like [Thunnus maccoyii]
MVLMRHNLDKFNIIKFYNEFFMNSRISLAFEMLDISLQEYPLDLGSPKHLADITTVIQQMATAFDPLKRIGVIHTDVKLDKVTMVDQVRQSVKVKLIDLGLAIFRSQAKAGRVHQTPCFRQGMDHF